MQKPILEATLLNKSFGKLKAVEGVNLTMHAGQCLGLLGPNGAGKTTTIEILEGIKSADSGSILYQGEIQGKLFKDQAGIMFQATALQEFITVYETLEMFSGLYENPHEIEELIELCALKDFLYQDNKKLSGGQRQRLLFAIALINRPNILFLDEPTTGLDPQSRRNFWALIESIKQQGKTILLTTHYMEEAFELCDQIIIMDHGKVISTGTPKELLSEHFKEIFIRLPLAHFEDEQIQSKYQAQIMGNEVEILTTELEIILKQLIEDKIPLNELRIREATLDDLFLKLTGEELRP